MKKKGKSEVNYKKVEVGVRPSDLKALFKTAADIVERRNEHPYYGKDGERDVAPLFFLLGALIPLSGLLYNSDNNDELAALARALADGATKALEGFGCYVVVKEREEENITPPENGTIGEEIIEYLAKDMPPEVKAAMIEVVERLSKEHSNNRIKKESQLTKHENAILRSLNSKTDAVN